MQTTTEINSAEIARYGALDMQVCIPEGWTDEQAIEFAESHNPCGTKHGWTVRKEGSPYLAGAKERVCCHDKPNFIHLMLDA